MIEFFLVPWLGVIVYVLAGGKGMQQRQLDQIKAKALV
jgi:hypothetical protein